MQYQNKKHKTIPDTTIEKIIDLQNENNASTLNEIQSKLPDPKPSIASISRILKQKQFTTKQLKSYIEQNNNALTKAKRNEYVENNQDYLEYDNTIFIDETGWKLSMKRNRGRSLKNTKAIKKMKELRGINITTIAAMSPKYGLLYYETQCASATEGGVNAARFNLFLSNLLRHRILRTKPFYIMMDNAPIHKKQDIEDIFQSTHSRQPKHHLIYLPPYSPFLDPLEEAFSVWKRYAQRSVLHSKQQLLDSIDRESTRIEPDLCRKLYEHTVSFFDRIIDGGDIV
jgi:transposase